MYLLGLSRNPCCIPADKPGSSAGDWQSHSRSTLPQSHKYPSENTRHWSINKSNHDVHFKLEYFALICFVTLKPLTILPHPLKLHHIFLVLHPLPSFTMIISCPGIYTPLPFIYNLLPLFYDLLPSLKGFLPLFLCHLTLLLILLSLFYNLLLSFYNLLPLFYNFLPLYYSIISLVLQCLVLVLHNHLPLF